ncbi:MAG: PAS domain S-box protein [Candidatus Omnitrophica bacterium]|nr:PAS domain S-box protein [Candidatus Omnitrophota bacterium]MCF7892279.1 PAS domain S-box protein [Candidatus Omnitrophota bacterium]MCF7895722.1 PAS domain S-box protein [Candidatus Omnitrophota bacterium]MCF7898306.1 PAS domain S-box protein [Candidatus Omnitrophota bacterium]MCF7909927.1 PAS domain S-box protein [Candidatus Omnitrophota bacterium]
MKTIKKMVPVMSVILLCGIILFALVFYSYQKLQTTTRKLMLSRKIVESSFNLNYLTSDYLFKPTKRIKTQWDISYAKFKKQTNQLEEEDLSPQEIKLVKKITRDSQLVKHHFSLIKSLRNKRAVGQNIDSKSKESGELVSLNLHQIMSAVFFLENIFQNNFSAVQKNISFWFLTTVVIFFSIFTGFIYRLFKDIRYRDETQKRLKEVNKRLRLTDRLVEFTGDGIYRYRYQDGKILFANQGFADIVELGRSPKELVGKNIGEVINYVQEPKTIRNLIDSKGSIRNYPYHFKTINGKDKWVLHNSFLIEEDGGEKILESIVTDITEQRKTEQQSRFLAGMLDNAPLSVIATNQQRKIVYINPATEKLYGYRKNELLGKDPIILNAEADAGEIEDDILAKTKNRKVYIKRLKNQKKNGDFFIVETAIYQLKDKSGNFVALVGFQKDVTEEIKNHESIRQSELKFRTIFQKAGAAIFVADPETGRILDCNQRAEDLMEAPRKKIIGLHQSRLHPKGKEKDYQQLFKDHLRKKTNADYEGQIENSRGVVKPVWISAELLDFGSKNLMVGFFTDLSLRTEYEKKEKEALKASVKAASEHAKAQELEKAYGELKSIQEKLIRTEKLAALGKLSGIVAHDLRNPLGVIRNSIYILKKKLANLPDSKVKKYLKVLDEEIEAADTIIEDVLNFTRLKNIKFLLFDLNKEIEKILTKIKIPANIRLKKTIDKNIPKIKADKEQLRRVFINLINNGIEAMPEGGELSVTTALKNSFVCVDISDNGVGIKREDKHKIFEPMYSTKVHGTGLGLSACKNIVTAHQGQIKVESRRGKGTKILVKIPLNR